MAELYRGHQTGNFEGVPAAERKVRDIVEEFLAGNYFVDEQALKLWLSQRGNTEQEFSKARQKVIDMFRNLKYESGSDMVITWVKELFEAKSRS